jgi:LacI family transcriptional regulator
VELLGSEEGRDVTAVLAGNDMIALGCLEAFAGAGLRCPEDVSLVGHNDMPLVERVQPPLTTVSIPQREIGAQAAAMLLARLRGEDAPAGETRLLPTRLVVRASTAPPRSG